MNHEVNFRADLHVHSFCSDGTDSPSQILLLAKEKKLSGLSITDHDTIEAYTPEFFDLAATLNIELLVGVELSSEWRGASVHILGYGFEKSLKSFLIATAIKRKERNEHIVEKLKKRGISINLSQLEKNQKIVGRPHIAQALVDMGACSSIRDAFERYLKDTACCSVIGSKLSPKEVIDAIHASSGKAVLAHPHLFKHDRLLQEILTLPFDGIECHYSLLHKSQEAPWVALAKKKGWIATGGSDYHGAVKPQIHLGCSWVGEPIFRALQGCYKQ